MDELIKTYLLNAYNYLSEALDKINIELKALNESLKREFEKEKENNEN